MSEVLMELDVSGSIGSSTGRKQSQLLVAVRKVEGLETHTLAFKSNWDYFLLDRGRLNQTHAVHPFQHSLSEPELSESLFPQPF